MKNYKNQLKIIFFFLVILCINQNQKMIATTYQPNNIIELTSGKQIESFNSSNNSVQEYYSHIDLIDKDPSFRILDCALFSRCASIIVHANLLASWMDARADYVNYKEKGDIKPKLTATNKTKNESPFYIKYEEYHFTRNACILDTWNIYNLLNNNYFLLIPKSANLEQAKQYFVLDNNEVFEYLETLELVTEKITAKQQPSNTPDQYTIKDIFQPNSTEWIFFHVGHGEEPDILPQQAATQSFNKNNLNICYERIGFLGTTIKAIANFSTTTYAFKEHATAIKAHLNYVSKGAEFTPYTYGIFPITAQVQTDEIKRIQGKTLTNFFTQLRLFAKTPSNLTSTNHNLLIPFIRDAHLHGNTLNSFCYLDNRLLLNIAKAPQFVDLTFAPPTIVTVPAKETKNSKKTKTK